MKDAATNVLVHQKSMSLSELSLVELKFTIETLSGLTTLSNQNFLS